MRRLLVALGLLASLVVARAQDIGFSPPIQAATPPFVFSQEPYVYGHSFAWGQGSTNQGTDQGGISGLFNTSGGYIGHELGFPGETSTQLLAEIVNHPILKTHPVLLWVGFNNVGQIAQVMSDLAAMVNYIGHPYILVLYEPVKSSTTTGVNQWTNGTGGTSLTTNRISLDALNAAYAAAYPGRTVNWLTPVATDPGAIMPQALLSDGFLHPNDAGYNAIYTAGGVKSAFDALVASVPGDFAPNPFAFTSVIGQQLSSTTTSNAIQISGINRSVTISIVGGSYSVNGGGFTPSPGVARDGDNIALQVVNSASPSVTTTATVTIGSVSAGFSSTTVTSGNLIVNGDFSVGTGWPTLVNCSISGGQLVFSSSSFGAAGQNISYTIGKQYLVTYTVSGYSSGSVHALLFGGTNVAGASHNTNGTFSDTLTAVSGNTSFRLAEQTGNGTYNIDNVSMYQVN